MPVRLRGQASADIPVHLLVDGEMGVITEWPSAPDAVGRLVSRSGDELASIGTDWHFRVASIPKDREHRVRQLQTGDVLDYTMPHGAHRPREKPRILVRKCPNCGHIDEE